MYRFAEGVHDDVQAIKDEAYEVNYHATKDVCADLRKIINNPKYSDVVFVCNDGAKVHGCRLFLVARSEVLHRMLLNGMAESRLSEITLHEVSSPELLPVMEYLYTGVLKQHAPKDWKHACHILRAATFFTLEGLEVLVQEYLLEAAKKVEKDMEAVVKFLCIAVEFIELLGETVGVIARHLVCSLVYPILTTGASASFDASRSSLLPSDYQKRDRRAERCGTCRIYTL